MEPDNNHNSQAEQNQPGQNQEQNGAEILQLQDTHEIGDDEGLAQQNNNGGSYMSGSHGNQPSPQQDVGDAAGSQPEQLDNDAQAETTNQVPSPVPESPNGSAMREHQNQERAPVHVPRFQQLGQGL